LRNYDSGSLFFIGEPQLSRRNLRSGIGGQRSPSPPNETLVSDILAMSDGRSDNLKMAEAIGESVNLIDEWGENLVEAGLLREIGR